MSEQSPKFTCELCGGAHPTSEHEKQRGAETKAERQYEVVEGIRFDKKFSPEAIHKILELIHHHEKLFKESEYNREDIRARMHHAVAMSSTYLTRDPLAPYAVQAGTISREEVLEKNKVEDNSFDRGTTLKLLGPSSKNFEPKSWVGLQAPEKVFAALKQWILAIKSGVLNKEPAPPRFSLNEWKERLNLSFGQAELNPTTMRYNLPYLEGVNDKKLPKTLQEKVKLGWIKDPFASRHFSWATGVDVTAYIDQQGWCLRNEKGAE